MIKKISHTIQDLIDIVPRKYFTIKIQEINKSIIEK